MILNLFESQLAGVRVDGDDSRDGLTHPFVRNRHNESVGDRRVCMERRLDLFGKDFLATGVDALRAATEEDDGAVCLHPTISPRIDRRVPSARVGKVRAVFSSSL